MKSKLRSICFHELKIYNIPTWTFKFYLHHTILNENSFHWNWDKCIDKIQTNKHEVRVIQAQDKLNVTAWNEKNLLLGSTSERDDETKSSHLYFVSVSFDLFFLNKSFHTLAESHAEMFTVYAHAQMNEMAESAMFNGNSTIINMSGKLHFYILQSILVKKNWHF